MKFADFICFEAIVAQLQASGRDDVIKELVLSLEKAGKLSKGLSKDIAKAIITRENEASTGMGKGVAIPHVKHKSVKEVIGVVGLSSAGIDFLALDKQPVHSVILLISPVDDPDTHLITMEYIFKNLQREIFRKFLRQCSESEQVKDLLIEADEDTSL
jgi:mannitol/fructose-specific phosphotransferase system IIA component (Ntr-type)